MGHPEHPHQRSSSGGVFVALAVVLALGLLVAGVVALVGYSLFSVRTVMTTSSPPVPMQEYRLEATTYATISPLVVEVDPQGQTSVGGQPKPLEEIEAQFRQILENAVPVDPPEIYAVEGTPFEHVEKVKAMFRKLGYDNPNIDTVPPFRHVVVQLDAEGNPTIDGQAAPEIQTVLQQIAQEHGGRATITVQVHPQCPTEAVVRVKDLCNQLGFGKVTVEALPETNASEPE